VKKETYKPKETDWVAPPYSMICGSYEAEIRRYKRYEDKEGCVWLVAIQEDAACNIYWHNPRDKDSQGFAGRTLHFPLEDGSVYEAKGPWHTNSDAFFQKTGIDIRDKHRTFVVLSKDIQYQPGGYCRPIMVDVVYKDEAPTIGHFDRYKELIKLHPEAKCYHSQSSGGSSTGWINDHDRGLK
jgi:hypothetical protein